jgi:hypothetical protein
MKTRDNIKFRLWPWSVAHEDEYLAAQSKTQCLETEDSPTSERVQAGRQKSSGRRTSAVVTT